MLGHVGHNDSLLIDNLMIRICVLAPNAVPDPAQLVQLAEKAVASAPDSYFYLSTLGAALYRAGDFRAALQRLNEAKKFAPTGTPEPEYALFQAMAHHRVDHAHEARQWLGKAVEWIDESTQERQKGGTTSSASTSNKQSASKLDWADRLVLQSCAARPKR